MYVIELVFTAITYLEQRNMDEPRKAAKPARGQLNWEIKSPCRCIRGKYIYMYCCLLFVYIPGIFLFGDMCIRARFTAVSAYMCIYSGMYNCIYLCSSHINRVRLPILLVVS